MDGGEERGGAKGKGETKETLFLRAVYIPCLKRLKVFHFARQCDPPAQNCDSPSQFKKI